MSIAVDVAALDHEMAGRPYAYLLTVSDDARPHAVAVTPTLVDGVLTTDVGRRTAANADARPSVSLVFPPSEPGGYSLIVDANAVTIEGRVELTPSRAVLHRPAPGPERDAADGSCVSDCVELAEPTT